MRSWIRRSSSILAIAGGVLFLVLPVAFLSETVSIAPPLPRFQCHPPQLCRIFAFRPSLAGMVSFWVALGIIGMLLGVAALILGPRPRVGFAMGLAFSLGSIALLFSVVSLEILKDFIVTPAGFLLFPETAIVAMAGATALFGYEFLRRGREIIDDITS